MPVTFVLFILIRDVIEFEINKIHVFLQGRLSSIQDEVSTVGSDLESLKIPRLQNLLHLWWRKSKQQLDRDIETLKSQSNIVSIRADVVTENELRRDCLVKLFLLVVILVLPLSTLESLNL
ncbi:unnamed protein product [Lactuca virosa]|uniref:Uncharacterized protein n=1 Tax=Lactuca virosa TaxID=75947 RepID=A0AAU9MDC0_9ASTR|nr:unnamed protein product [Lactuca virosa]